MRESESENDRGRKLQVTRLLENKKALKSRALQKALLSSLVEGGSLETASLWSEVSSLEHLIDDIWRDLALGGRESELHTYKCNPGSGL